MLARMVALSSAGALLAGCPPPAPPPSVFPTADAALDRMKASFACVNGVQGRAKIENMSPEGRVRGEVYIFAVNPDRVRFEVVSPFGVTLYALASDGRRFEMVDLEHKEFLHGPASACNLARLTQVPVPGHALVSLLRGEAPVLAHEPAGATIAWDRGFYRVSVAGKHDATQQIHLEVRPEDWSRPWSEQRLRVTDVRVSQRGVPLYGAELRHHERGQTSEPRVDEEGLDAPIPPSGGPCDAELPRSIRISVPHTDRVVTFQYKEARFNPPILPGAFDLTAPSGTARRFVDCGP